MQVERSPSPGNMTLANNPCSHQTSHITMLRRECRGSVVSSSFLLPVFAGNFHFSVQEWCVVPNARVSTTPHLHVVRTECLPQSPEGRKTSTNHDKKSLQNWCAASPSERRTRKIQNNRQESIEKPGGHTNAKSEITTCLPLRALHIVAPCQPVRAPSSPYCASCRGCSTREDHTCPPRSSTASRSA